MPWAPNSLVPLLASLIARVMALSIPNAREPKTIELTWITWLGRTYS